MPFAYGQLDCQRDTASIANAGFASRRHDKGMTIKPVGTIARTTIAAFT
jgi:hypothetical protein